MTTPAILYFDGGVRPTNPGPAAIGYTIEAEDWYDESSVHIGKATSNEAEYHALIRGLEVTSKEGCAKVEARGDSQLIVNQVKGDYDTNKHTSATSVTARRSWQRSSKPSRLCGSTEKKICGQMSWWTESSTTETDEITQLGVRICRRRLGTHSEIVTKQ